MVAQTFVSLHLYGYGTVLATIQKIFTTDGRRPRSTTRFYTGFGVDSNVYDYRRHGGLVFPEVRGTAELHSEVYHPLPIRSLPRTLSQPSSLFQSGRTG